ncbi:MAG TPA: hypothetical protein VHX42_01480 [Candidatus Babeliales bacterium]|jgi:hypothetical protein|nr:hypothetical protein [Candidatus Babeliales bacterium]
MTSDKMIVKLLCFFTVIAVTFSVNAMKRASDCELEELYKKYTIADDFVLPVELTNKHQENKRMRYQDKLETEEEDVAFANSLNKLLQQLEVEKKQKSTPMPRTPMPTSGNKKAKPNVPVNVLLQINDHHQRGNVLAIEEILANPVNRQMLQGFDGYTRPHNLPNNFYLSAERMRQNNNNS